MSEQNDLAVPPAPPEPSVEVAPPLASGIQTLPPAEGVEEVAKSRIAALEREAKALGTDPSSAPLYHAIGLLWEDPLRNPRNAAVAYQNAFKIAPRFLPNLRAARRLFFDVGNWQMALQLLEAELAATDRPRDQAGLLFEKARLLEERLARADDALTCYRQALTLQPKDVPLLVQLQDVFAARKDYASLVQVDLQLAALAEDPSLRARYFTSAGLLHERLGDLPAAAGAFRSAFALDRRSVLLLSAMKRLAETEANTEELLAVLAAEAELAGPQASATYLQIAKIHERQNRREDARSALLAARHASPKDPLVLSALASIHEADGRHEDLADVLTSWVESINDESELVAINLRLAALYEDELKREEEAVTRYRAILARIPGHAPALAGLGKLYFRQQNWAQLIEVFEAEAASATDPRQKAARLFKAAELLEEKLQRPDEAIARYTQCLHLQPGYLPAQKALTRLYEKMGRWLDLAALFEQDLLHTTDREQVIAILSKMATLYEDRLEDLDHAVECLRRILEVAPDHLLTLRHLGGLYERAGRWLDLIQLHDVEASLVGDTKQVISIHHRTAEILEEQLEDLPGAVAAYERLLALSPSYLPALKALGRLYAKDGRWADLIRMYRAEAEISPSTDQAASLIEKIGELHEHKLRDENEAIASYQEVLTLAPSSFSALRSLARIYGAQGAWENLVEILRSEAANRTDPVERANSLFQAAAIWEDHLERLDLAIEGYQEVLKINPAHPAAIHALERLYGRTGQIKELIAVLDRQTQTESTSSAKVAAYLKLSELYFDRLEEAPRAAQCAEAALSLEPSHVGALQMLQRVRASDRVRRAELKAKLSDQVADPRLRGALRLSSALDNQTDASSRLAELQRAVIEDPSDLRLSFDLERALRQNGDAEGLIALHQQRLRITEAPEDRRELALRIAELYELKRADPHRALEYYRMALELEPTFLPALQGARRMYQLIGDDAAARAALETEATTSRDPRSVIDAWVAAGRICAERLGDPDGAAAAYRKALERDPLDPAASSALEDLLASRGGVADLADLHERRGEAKLAQKNAAAGADELLAAARLRANELNDPERAEVLVDQALAAQPQLGEALELKGRLALAAGHHAEAADALSRRAQQGGEARKLSLLHLQLGILYQDHLEDPSRAAAHFQTALAGDAQNLEALDRLATLHIQSRNWTGAADCLEQLVSMETDPASLARHTLALARIVEEGFGDLGKAAGLYRKALELQPSDPEPVERLVAIYERQGNLPELATLLGNQAQATADPTQALALRLRLGELWAGPLQGHERAVASYRAALELDPTCLPAHESLAALYAKDSSTLNLAVEQYRRILRIDPTRTESLHALFGLWEAAQQHDRALSAASVLALLDAANEAESAAYTDWRGRLPTDPKSPLGDPELEALIHPSARNAVLELLKAMGEQVARLFPTSLDALGIDRKADKLRSDHAVHKALRAVTQLFRQESFDVYQSKRGNASVELTEPLAVCIGQELVRKFNAREQRFFFGRIALTLVDRSAATGKLSQGEITDLLGNCVRLHVPDFALFGRRSDESIKQIKKAFSRKVLKAMEGPANALAGASKLDLPAALEGLTFSDDRAGLLMCGDPGVALGVLGRELGASAPKDELSRPRMKELLAFALSEDYFRLRQKLGLALG